MASSYRSSLAPPQFTKDISYTDWKKEVEFWQIATEAKEEKQGAAIFLSLTGKSREAVLELTKEEIGAKDGVSKVLKKLDELWQEDDKKAAFNAYEMFEQFKRPYEMDVMEYINAFERLNNKLKKHKMELPDGVLAYRVLKSANLSKEQEQLAKATVNDVSYKAMCDKLKAICAKVISSNNHKNATPAIEFKQETYLNNPEWANEDVYYNSDPPGYVQRSRGRFRGRGGGRRTWSSSQKQQPQQPRKNPADNTGKTSRCTICDSQYHWMRDCTQRWQNRPPAFSLFANTSIQKCYISKLVGETFSGGLLDCGCTKTVCGTEWFEDFVNNLPEEERRNLEVYKSNVPYRFGDNDVVYSYQTAKIPIEIANQKGFLETQVVQQDIPLLISKDAMQKSEMVLDFTNDTATFLGEEVKLETTSSGHYIIPLTKKRSMCCVEKEEAVMFSLKLENKCLKEKKKIAARLHSQFGHPPHDKLCDLVTKAGVQDKEFIELMKQHAETCEPCERHRRKNPRPAVGMSLSKEFNGTIAMDLKIYRQQIILHMIDLATRYSNAVVIKNKKKETVVDNIIKHWINTFGVPDRILTDNGGEFSNRDFIDMGENLNTEVVTTAAESPWSNGVCERHNAVIGSMLDKILCETSCELEVALAWAVNAKNALHNVYGFSPCQLVFGRNPNLPAILNDKLPALGGTTKSEEVAKHLNAKHEARKAFIECEAEEKLRRAMRGLIRESTTKVFEPGDKVYYKRLDSNYWKGPATVFGKDNHQVAVIHNGQLVRVHPVSLRKVTDPEYHEKGNDVDAIAEEAAVENQRNGTEPSLDVEPVNRIEFQEEVVTVQQCEPVSEENTTDNTTPEVDNEESRAEAIVNVHTVPQVKSRINFRNIDADEEWKEGIVISRAGKATGKNRMWMNVKGIPDEVEEAINFDNIEWKHKEESALLSQNYDFNIINAKKVEIENLLENGVYEEVPDEGQMYIDSRWVMTEKTGDDGVITVKARLVAKGFQEQFDQRTDSPTCNKTNLRCLLAIAATNKWKVRSLDIKSAFLQGRTIEREIFIKPPCEISVGVLWKLNKAIYGLNDASREWYLKVCETMMEMGAEQSKLDNAVFFWKQGGSLVATCAVHVDDFIKSGERNFLQKLIEDIKKRFKVSSECDGLFKYLGFEIEQDNETIKISQNQYVNQIKLLAVPVRGGDVSLSNEEKRNLKSLAGQINWVSSQSRPDMAFDACEISTSVKDATVRDIINANKALKKMQSENVRLTFPVLGDLREAKLICYTDASFANLRGKASQGGYCVFLQGPSGKHAVLTWQSKKVKRVVKSTLAAEALSMQEGAEHSFVVAAFLKEITGIKEGFPVTVRIDNSSLEKNLKTSNTLTEKRLNLDVMILREMLERQEINDVEWVPNEEQLADCLTKKGASSKKLLRAIHNQ